MPAVAGDDFPRFSAPLVDAADVVASGDEERINSALLDYQRRTTNQIAIAVVDTIGDNSLEDYANDLFEEWGVGEEDKDNGVLLLVAMEERELRVEVGFGLEGELTDLESGQIVDNMAPLMRRGEVGEAIYRAQLDIRRALNDEGLGALPVRQPEDRDEPESSFPQLAFALIPLFFIFMAMRGARRRGRRRRDFGLWPIFIGGGWGGSSGGGFGGGGFGGGGFGGGGGGSSGGGGASGGW